MTEHNHDDLANLIAQFTQQMMRILAGKGNELTTAKALFNIIDYMADNDHNLLRSIQNVRDLIDITRPPLVSDYDNVVYLHDAVVVAALSSAAERLATDPLRHARKNQADDNMKDAIDRMVVNREENSRKHGWSYNSHILQKYGVR